MDGQQYRRFGLVDAIILIAATAGGLAFVHAMASDNRFNMSSNQARDLTESLVVAVAFCWTCALLGLQLTRYHRPRREMASRPGFAAMIAVLMDFAGGAIHQATLLRIESSGIFPPVRWDTLFDCLYHIFYVYTGSIGISYSRVTIIATAWSLMWMAGFWRPERSWLDRTGRVLGIFWIGAYFLYWLCRWCFPDPIPNWSPPGWPGPDPSGTTNY